MKIDKIELEFIDSQDILGLRFNTPKLKWSKHIGKMIVKSLNRVNIMKKINILSYNWGAKREFLMKFYNIYVKPKLEYGLLIYGTK